MAKPPKFSDEELTNIYKSNGCNYRAVSRITGLNPSQVQRQIERFNGQSHKAEKAARLKALDEALEMQGIDPRHIDIRNAKIREGEWDVTAKVKIHDPETGKVIGHRLETKKNHGKGVEILFSPKFKEGPEYPLIQPAPVVKVVHRGKPPLRNPDVMRAIVLTDEQMGYWRDLDTEEYSAFHDERALDVSLQVVEYTKPNRVLFGGDMLDNPEWQTKFRKFPEFQHTTQRTLNRAGLWIDQVREAAPADCEFDMVEGNHDARIPNFILDYASQAHNIRPAYDQRTKPNSWPAFTVPWALDLDERGVRYSAAYPGGEIFLNDGIVLCHQDERIRKEERATLIHGHRHTASEDWITVWHRGRQLRRGVISVGCLARIDPIVDNLFRRMRSSIPAGNARQNWQQGILVIDYVRNGGPSDCEVRLVQINDGVAWFDGRRFEARPRDINGHLIESR